MSNLRERLLGNGPSGKSLRILYLTEDFDLLLRQLEGKDLRFDPSLALLDAVSTDEITPAHGCYFFDDRLAGYLYTGLRGGRVPMNAVRGGDFSVVVSGRSKGSGSSREAAPFAEHLAGIRLIVATSFEKIYRQNCHNIGLLTTTDFSVLARLTRGQPVDTSELVADLDPISKEVVEEGGLFAYSRARTNGRIPPPAIATPPRPMTIAEKILAGHAVVQVGAAPAIAVAPGDALLVRTDVRFSHEYVTAMADGLFRAGFGEDAQIRDPASVITFRDHLTLLDRVMPDEHRQKGLHTQAALLAELQGAFAERHHLRLYGEVRRDGVAAGSEGICHNKIVEDIALPGQIVVGTDSHTCTAGALGCLAFGVGSTDMANAWYTQDVRVAVPKTVRVVLRGRLGPFSCAKDVMLHLLALEPFQRGAFLGHVLEFSGDGVSTLPIDERATLANMAVEGGAFTGVVDVDDRALEWLRERRGLALSELMARVVRADAGAEYAAIMDIDLGEVEPMIALPGDPRNGVPLSRFLAEHGAVAVDIAYGGSCVGGKAADLDQYARVLAAARARGLRVADGVELFIQFGSQEVRRYAETRGYLPLFEDVGAELLDPACGACIRAGPGVSEREDQVTISSASRNYPGRSGPGRVYLGSPLLVAASAVFGKITDPRALLGDEA